MTNADAARIFARLATMLEIDGANPFRVRAYREAARVVESQGEPVATRRHRPEVPERRAVEVDLRRHLPLASPVALEGMASPLDRGLRVDGAEHGLA